MSIGNKYGTKWSEAETIMAYYYYCTRIPFSSIDMSNPEVIKLAELLGRTPGSVSLKLANLAHHDPDQKNRYISGMKNTSKLDKEIVERFYSNWEALSFTASQIEIQMKNPASSLTFAEDDNTYSEVVPPLGKEIEVQVKQRVNQDFFRRAVLTTYSGRCCITGLSEKRLLIASHIKPWRYSDPSTERTNPSNGLCLNALHDKAFDQGLITVLPNYTIRVSSSLKSSEADDSATRFLLSYDKEKIILPNRFLPKKEFLEYHNDVIFIP